MLPELATTEDGFSHMDAINQLGLQTTGSPVRATPATAGTSSIKQDATPMFSELVGESKAVVSPADSKAAEVNRKLEAMLLSQFISEFIKHDSEAVFGTGVQGDFYKSLFADAIAEQMSGKGILGFAELA